MFCEDRYSDSETYSVVALELQEYDSSIYLNISYTKHLYVT